MKTKIAAIFAALITALTATAGIAETITAEAFASAGPAVTELSMTTNQVFVSEIDAGSVTQINFGLRLQAKNGSEPVNGSFAITSIGYRRLSNGTQKVSTTLGAFNPAGDISRPDIMVKNVAGTTVSVNGVQTAGSVTVNGSRLLVEDHRVLLNGTTAPFLAVSGDTATAEYTVAGSFNGVPFSKTVTASVTVLDVPSIPANFRLSSNPGGQTVFEWTDASDETSYELEQSTDGSNWTMIASLEAEETTFTKWFKSCESRQFRVRASNVRGYTPSQVVEMPGIVTVTMPAGQLTLTVISVTGLQQSQVEVSSDLVTWIPVPEGTTVTGLPPSQTLSFPVMGSRAQVRLRSRTIGD